MFLQSIYLNLFITGNQVLRFGRGDWINFDHSGFIIISPWFDGHAMMIYVTILIIPQKIHVGVQENFNEWKKQIEDEPDVNHLDRGGFRKVIGHADEHGGEHQKGTIASDIHIGTHYHRHG